jgi:hypothetical protein
MLDVSPERAPKPDVSAGYSGFVGSRPNATTDAGEDADGICA